jgi:hypothetical protein
VQVHAVSGKGSVTGYRFDFGDGSPLQGSTSPMVTHPVANGGAKGPVVVLATDDLGHAGLEVARGGP